MRKRETTELPRETAPTVEEEPEIEEMGGLKITKSNQYSSLGMKKKYLLRTE